MTDSKSEHPKRLLLATDLSARTDRALDRAVLLAGEWQAELVILHVLEDETVLSDGMGPLPSWRRPPDPQKAAEQQLRADLRGLAPNATVVVESGKPGDVILHTADALKCDMIVTGLARNELLGRFSLGGTVDWLLRRSNIPLLIVKDRARSPYKDILVATDFSDPSRHALATAARIFDDQQLTVFHAYDAPMAGLTTDAESYRREYSEVAAADCKEFLRSVQLPEGKPPKIMLEWGAPAHLLRDYAEKGGFDLAVIGTQGRSAVFDLFIGSVARQILAEMPRDALVVRQPTPRSG